MIIPDSNFWIALYNEADSQHKKALSLSARGCLNDVLIPEYIILEVSSVLSLKGGNATAELFLEKVFDNHQVTVLFSSRDLFEGTLNLFRDLSRNLPRAKLSFVDVSLLYLSKEHTILTFDKVLEKEIKKYAKTH